MPKNAAKTNLKDNLGVSQDIIDKMSSEIQVDNEVISLEHLKVNNTYTMTVCKNFSELHFIAKEK